MKLKTTNIEDNIIKCIAENYPFYFYEIRSAFLLLESFDNVIFCANKCGIIGMGLIEYAECIDKIKNMIK